MSDQRLFCSFAALFCSAQWSLAVPGQKRHPCSTSIGKPNNALPFDQTGRVSPFPNSYYLRAMLKMHRFPPVPAGFPRRRYEYHIPGSSVTLECFRFIEEKELDSAVLFRLFDRAYGIFSNPHARHDPVEPLKNYPDGFRWIEKHTDGSETMLMVFLPNRGHYKKMDEGQMIDILIGINNLVIDYPQLEIDCEVTDEYEDGPHQIGIVVVRWDPDDE